MTLGDARELANAHSFAGTMGTPLNAHATITLEHATAFGIGNWLDWQNRFLDKLSRWLHRHDIPPAYVWVRELGERRGPHLHLLLHLTDFTHQRDPLTRWMGATAFPPQIAALSPPFAPVQITGGRYGMQTAPMRAGSLRYILKTLDPDATVCTTGNRYSHTHVATALGINTVDAEPLVGRRYGVAHGIGPAMRAAASWRELHDLPALARYLNPNNSKEPT